MSARSYLSIGDVLTLLRQEFPDITISKIRFLESQGLVNPERTPSGYRKFYEHDVERLRWVLRQQREHFLPLKVIKDRLDDEAIGAVSGAARSAKQSPAPVAAESAGAEPVSAAEPVLVGQRASMGGSSAVGSPADAGKAPDRALVARGAAVASTGAPAVHAVASTTSASDGTTDSSGHGPVGRERDASLATSSQRSAPSVATANGSGNGTGTGTGSGNGTGDGIGAAAPVEDRATPETPSITSATKAPAGSARPVAPVPTPTAHQASSVDDAPETTPASTNFDMGAMGGASLSMAELTAASGLTEAYVVQLQEFGLLRATVLGGTEFFDEEALTVANVAAKFAAFGLEARHLRLYKNAADREVGLIEQIVLPMIRQRNPEARARANQTADDLARLGQQLKGSLLRSGLRDLLNG